MSKLRPSLVIAIAVVLLATKTATAQIVTYGFPPVSGDAFSYDAHGSLDAANSIVRAQWSEPPSPNSYGFAPGVLNWGTHENVAVASIGYGVGGYRAFDLTLLSEGPPGQAYCEIDVNPGQYPFSANTTAGPGGETLAEIATNVPVGGPYFYSVACSLTGEGSVSVLGIDAVGVYQLVPQAGASFINQGAYDTSLTYVGGAAVSSASGTGTYVVASLGSGVDGQSFTVWGNHLVSSAGTGYCMINNSSNGFVTGTATTSGVGSFSIPAGSSNYSFYQTLCWIPPGGQLFGIVPNEAQSYLGPVAGTGFLNPNPGTTVFYEADNVVNPNGSTNVESVYASLGYAGGGSTTFAFAGVSPGTSCSVSVLNPQTGASGAFSGAYVNGTIYVPVNATPGPNYFYSAACSIPGGGALQGVYPSTTVYDPPAPGAPPTQCRAGTTTMHCCPIGYAMIGSTPDWSVFKCAPLQNATGAVTLDTGTQRNGMHSCPLGQVVVGFRLDQNGLACQALPAGSITSERVDTGTQDAYPMHVCDAGVPSSAVSGIRADQNHLNCATNPQLNTTRLQ